MSKQKSFTLIELLVVIAIFGLLASVVVVSVQGAKDKARIASLLTYSATVKRSLGADIVGEWRFEEGSGYDVADSSGYKNNGTWQGTGEHWEQNSIRELGWAGKFSGDDKVLIQDSNSLDIKNEITIEAWIKTGDIASQWYVVNKPDAYGLLFDSQSPRLNWGDYLACGINPFVVGRWHHFVGTDNGSKITIIVDGKEICSQNYNSEISVNGENLYLGTADGSTDMFFGDIDEVRIYSRGLTQAEIQKHYVEGAEKRGIAIEK